MTFVTASLALAFFLRLFSSPFFSFFPFLFLFFFLWFGWSVASPCAHMWQQLWSLSLSFHLCTGRTWQRFVPFGPFSFSLPLLLLWLFSFLSFFIVYYSFIIIATVRFCVCASVCAPLYASMRAPLFQLGQLQIKQNTHTHRRTHTYPRNLLMNWQIIKYANWTWPVAVTEGQRRGTRHRWTGWRAYKLTKWQLSRPAKMRHHVYANDW